MLGRLALDLHTFGDRQLARRLKLGLLGGHVPTLLLVVTQDIQHHRWTTRRRSNLHQTHAAVGGYAEPRMPAIVRNIDAAAVGRRDDSVTRLKLYLSSVETKCGHNGRPKKRCCSLTNDSQLKLFSDRTRHRSC